MISIFLLYSPLTAPLFIKEENETSHQWIIEFEKEPEDFLLFCDLFDKALQGTNSDYEAKRYKDFVLKKPQIIKVPKGTFYHWLKSKGKLGGQHKVPRLSNERTFIEEILKQIQ